MIAENFRTHLYDKLRHRNEKFFKWLVQKNLLRVYRKPILRDKAANALILRCLQEKRPVLVSRLGSVELNCINFFIFQRLTNRSYTPNIKGAMTINAGFFPADDAHLDRFSVLFLEGVRSVDIMGAWFNRHEDYICRKYCPHAHIIPLHALEPYYHVAPWSTVLENKTVLVVHPFVESIRRQYESVRQYLFSNCNVLPIFALKTVKTVQSIGSTKTEFQTWFDALEYMKERIAMAGGFDVAIIGAGAYGLPLAAYIKRLGKPAIHMGGATQILFGIKGSRWDRHPVIGKFYNQYWIRPLSEETPATASHVENGCYW